MEEFYKQINDMGKSLDGLSRRLKNMDNQSKKSNTSPNNSSFKEIDDEVRQLRDTVKDLRGTIKTSDKEQKQRDKEREQNQKKRDKERAKQDEKMAKDAQKAYEKNQRKASNNRNSDNYGGMDTGNLFSAGLGALLGKGKGGFGTLAGLFTGSMLSNGIRERVNNTDVGLTDMMKSFMPTLGIDRKKVVDMYTGINEQATAMNKRINKDLLATSLIPQGLLEKLPKEAQQAVKDIKYATVSTEEWNKALSDVVATGIKGNEKIMKFAETTARLDKILPGLDFSKYTFSQKAIDMFSDGNQVVEAVGATVSNLTQAFMVQPDALADSLDSYETFIQYISKSSAQYSRSLKNMASATAILDNAFVDSKKVIGDLMDFALTPLSEVSAETWTKYASLGLDTMKLRKMAQTGKTTEAQKMVTDAIQRNFGGMDTERLLSMASAKGWDTDLVMQVLNGKNDLAEGNKLVASGKLDVSKEAAQGVVDTKLKENVYVNQKDATVEALQEWFNSQSWFGKVLDTLSEMDLGIGDLVGAWALFMGLKGVFKLAGKGIGGLFSLLFKGGKAGVGAAAKGATAAASGIGGLVSNWKTGYSIYREMGNGKIASIFKGFTANMTTTSEGSKALAKSLSALEKNAGSTAGALADSAADIAGTVGSSSSGTGLLASLGSLLGPLALVAAALGTAYTLIWTWNELNQKEIEKAKAKTEHQKTNEAKIEEDEKKGVSGKYVFTKDSVDQYDLIYKSYDELQAENKALRATQDSVNYELSRGIIDNPSMSPEMQPYIQSGAYTYNNGLGMGTFVPGVNAPFKSENTTWTTNGELVNTADYANKVKNELKDNKMTISQAPTYKGPSGWAAVDSASRSGETPLTAISNWLQGLWDKLPRHATGLGYVPYNDYTARLHEGEAVLTSSEAQAWRAGSNGNMPTSAITDITKAGSNVLSTASDKLANPMNDLNDSVSNFDSSFTKTGKKQIKSMDTMNGSMSDLNTALVGDNPYKGISEDVLSKWGITVPNEKKGLINVISNLSMGVLGGGATGTGGSNGGSLGSIGNIISGSNPNTGNEYTNAVVINGRPSFINESKWNTMPTGVKESLMGNIGDKGNLTSGEKAFVSKILPGAIETYSKYNILPSITLAQAILESGWGTSGLSKKYNNYFGVKAGDSWSGSKVLLNTPNDAKKQNYFRVYGSITDSIMDHGKVIGTWDNYSGVTSATNYKDAAYALQGGKYHYAEDKNYSTKLINLIESLGLYEFDSAGRYLNGINYVPYDYFPMFADKGEQLLTATEAREYRGGRLDAEKDSLVVLTDNSDVVAAIDNLTFVVTKNMTSVIKALSQKEDKKDIAPAKKTADKSILSYVR